ncbi:MAG: ABC transporter ATPase [Bacteroidia bacterium]|nr:ABC transporter ATPase [Bacteroidia bacterium]
MNQSLTNMPPEAKVWIYAANRILTLTEKEVIEQAGQAFTTSWTAHQQLLSASFDILHNLFLVIAVNEEVAAVSGCGIDKSVHFITEINKQYNLDLFNRMQLELWENDQVVPLSKQELSVRWQQGNVNPQTIVFNKTVQTKSDFDKEFKQTLDQSWVYKSLTNLVAG